MTVDDPAGHRRRAGPLRRRRTSSRTTAWRPARAWWSPTTGTPPARTPAAVLDGRPPGAGRGVPRRSRGVAVRGVRRRDRGAAAAGAGLQAGRRRRHRAEHRRHGRLRAAAVGAGRTWSTRCSARVLDPVLAEMARRGTPFSGLLYAGLVLTVGRAEGDRVQLPVRRPGDPGRARAARHPARQACWPPPPPASWPGTGPLAWRGGAAVTVVIAAENYPGTAASPAT